MLHSDIAVFHLNQIWRNTNAFRTKCREYFYINHEKVFLKLKLKQKMLLKFTGLELQKGINEYVR